ncbi:DapH/DapD/GlmU-related protein [Mesorhizobium sp.]|uniref:DapH/DapD/GlmU-related protein n=1 Tax=Mesorhizobium sp. TaxID=1871066 RepID=UPI0025BC87D3|nr:DapH/DapD/GlmU-related protein [Mesorhizobium sp.]
MIHPLAVVEGAELGADVSIWQFASVIRGAKLGDGTSIGPYTKVDGAVIGRNCRIQDHCSINPGVVIGDYVFVGPGAIFCNDMWPDATHNGIDHEAVAAGVTVRVGDGASIGAGARILPGVTVGAGAVVAAGATVDRNVPAAMVWRRNGYISHVPPGRRTRMRLIC